MPSPAVVAKNALIDLLDEVNARLAARDGAHVTLPTGEQWGRITALAREALRQKHQKIEPGLWITWKDLKRLEKCYRPHLEFEKWYEPLVTAVEAGADPYSKLQAAHWCELCPDQFRQWSKRSSGSKVIGWLINKVRVHPVFQNSGISLSYESLKAKHIDDGLAQTTQTWITVGQLVSEQLGTPFVPGEMNSTPGAERAAKAGFERFVTFQKNHLEWHLKHKERGEDVHCAATQLRMLGSPIFEKRLVKLRYADLGAPGYNLPAVNDGNHLRRGQVPSLKGVSAAKSKQADTARKRRVNGAQPRSLVLPYVKQVRDLAKQLKSRQSSTS